MNGSLAYHSVALNIQHSCHILYIFGLLNAQNGSTQVHFMFTGQQYLHIHRELWQRFVYSYC